MSGQQVEQVEVLISEPALLHEWLDDAEALLRQVATVKGLFGILVTRHHPGRYTLELSESVPFGESREQSLA
ncbi:hypothetical protein OOZ51_21340 [Arthrobacter sp. MI7-26]|uniref:hypothetical protein n=1 Tax=Arthrobacter sp. MI7-26 TaxID=2993653 RepID=UPI0022496E1D|nr:hypothetical protein [Arthrobacter sp. MI7-26]MCX2750329.1 hypothetical protein [Arthrobacter sp. MI7-26]